MPDVDPLTKAELGERAGSTAEHIDRLVEAGIISPGEDEKFRVTDVQRVRLADVFDRSGITLESIGRAISAGHLSFSFVDLLFPEPAGYTTKTYEQLCAEMGWPVEFIQEVHRALTLHAPLPDEPVREDDTQMFPLAQMALAIGMDQVELARTLRVYGENIGRITDAESHFYHQYVEAPILRSGMSEQEMRDVASQVSAQLIPVLDRAVMWLYRRLRERAIFEHLVEHVEDALERAGVTPPRVARPPAMAFLDLAGYTRLTEERGDEAAAELATDLSRLVQLESARYGGKPVKWLGDGVMFHFADPEQAVLCSLDLVERTPAAGLPPAHVGVHAGPVIFRDGDYFGRTVNVASRISGKAGPGEVLVSADVVSVSSPDSVRFEEIGPVELKGLSRPVTLYRVTRPAAGSR